MEWIAIQFVVAFDAYFECTITQRPRHTKQHIAIRYLTPIECNPVALIHFAPEELGRTGDAAAIPSAIGEHHPIISQGPEEWFVPIDLKRLPPSVCQSDRETFRFAYLLALLHGSISR